MSGFQSSSLRIETFIRRKNTERFITEVHGGRTYRYGRMTGIWVSVAVLFSVVVVSLLLAMRS